MENPQEILNLISKKNVSRILINTHKKSRSVQELNIICGVPIAVCYKIIHRLENLGFMMCTEKRHNNKGKPVKYYRSQIINAQFFYEAGRFKAKIQMTGNGWEHYPPLIENNGREYPMQFSG